MAEESWIVSRRVAKSPAVLLVCMYYAPLLKGWMELTLSRIKDINTHCLKQFNAHWQCLENNNHHMFECRKPEVELNQCVFEKLVRLAQVLSLHCIQTNGFLAQGLKKTIPGTPENVTPVHLRPKQIYAQYPGNQY